VPSPPRPDPAGIPPASAARAGLRLAALVWVLGAGALLRLLLVPALPRPFLPGDPTTFLAMARGVLAHGVPRIDFVWNYATLPASISHVESFYEPGYAYLLAAVMRVFGATPATGVGLALVCGVLAIALTYRFARRFGPRVATVAAAIVAFEPWSIYYSGVLMKESLVAVVALLAIEALRRTASAGGGAWRTGLAAAGVVLGASVFEYELLPALGLAAALTLAVERRAALVPFLGAVAVAVAAALAAAWPALGVPISAKFGLLTGVRMWTTAAHGPGTYASPIGLARALPLAYALGAMLVKWYVPVPAMAWVGSRAKELNRADLLLPGTFAAAFLWVHGIPHDLWERDFIPLLPVFAPFVALAICRSSLWAARLGRTGPRLPRMSRGGVAVGVMGGTIVGVTAIFQLHVEGVLPARWMPWSAIVAVLALALMIVIVVRRIAMLFRLRPFRRAIPVLAMGVLLAAFSQSLPWTWIYRNPQFPNYELDRDAHTQACRMLDGVDRGAPVMASRPGEVALATGHPVVLLPVPADPRVVGALCDRYRVRYLLARDAELDAGRAGTLRLRRVDGRYGYTLYAFGATTAAAAVAAPAAVAPVAATPAPAPVAPALAVAP